MLPEDKLDALLSERLAARIAGDPAEMPVESAPDELEPRLAAVDQLAALRTALPRAAFARSLQARLLEHTARLQAAERNGQASRADALALERDLATVPNSDIHATEDITEDATGDVTEPIAMEADSVLAHAPHAQRAGAVPRWLSNQRLHVWQAVAAAVLLTFVGGGILATAAASAAPGSPLYSLRRFEQNVRTTLDSSPADRARLHLAYANDALTALDAAVAQQSGGSTYRDALKTVGDEERDATSALAAVSDTSEHTTLASALTALRQRERHDLHAALPHIDWPSRLLTTTALGQLGERVPVVTAIHIERSGGSDGHSGNAWSIVMSGTGFQPGAVCVINGQPVGTVVSATATQIEVTWPGDNAPAASAIGIQNPDDTAAETTRISVDDEGSDGGPSPTGTPGTGDDGHHGGDGGGDHGSGSATPTATSGGSGGDDSSGGNGGATPTATPTGADHSGR